MVGVAAGAVDAVGGAAADWLCAIAGP